MNTSSITVNESAGSVQICVTVLNGPVSSNLQVNVQFIQGTATGKPCSFSVEIMLLRIIIVNQLIMMHAIKHCLTLINEHYLLK